MWPLLKRKDNQQLPDAGNTKDILSSYGNSSMRQTHLKWMDKQKFSTEIQKLLKKMEILELKKIVSEIRKTNKPTPGVNWAAEWRRERQESIHLELNWQKWSNLPIWGTETKRLRKIKERNTASDIHGAVSEGPTFTSLESSKEMKLVQKKRSEEIMGKKVPNFEKDIKWQIQDTKHSRNNINSQKHPGILQWNIWKAKLKKKFLECSQLKKSTLHMNQLFKWLWCSHQKQGSSDDTRTS